MPGWGQSSKPRNNKLDIVDYHFIVLLSACTQKIVKMPRIAKENFQRSQHVEKIQECEGALIEMGYLRPKQNNKQKKKKQVKKKIDKNKKFKQRRG